MDSRCRLCADVYEELIEILNEADLCTKIHKFFHVDIVFNDKLPTTICYKCYEITHTTWNFNEQVQKAQEFLAQEYVSKPSLALTNFEFSNDDVLLTTATDEDIEDRREAVFISNNCENFVKDETLTMDTENERETTPKRCEGSPTNEFSNDHSNAERVRMEIKSESEEGIISNRSLDLEVRPTSTNEIQNDRSGKERIGVKTKAECTQSGKKKVNTDPDSDVSSDIEECEKTTLDTIVPEKSKALYNLTYEKFEKWCEEGNVKLINEQVLLAYFESKKKFKSSTLWSMYSMLRTQLAIKKGIDIKWYTSLIAFLRRQSNGYQAKKSKVFTKDNFTAFLLNTDDNKYLMAKVVLIIGIAGACRKSELTFLHTEDIQDEQSYFRISIPNSKTKLNREFVITPGELEGLNFVDIIRKYINLRPAKVKHNRFFIKYANGKCGVQPVGINTIGELPKVIARVIGLPNSALYTGQCFRRSSVTLLADCKPNFLNIKQYDGCNKSYSPPRTYVENLVQQFCNSNNSSETRKTNMESEEDTSLKSWEVLPFLDVQASSTNESQNDCSDTERNTMETNSDSEDDLNLKPFEVDCSNLEVQAMFVNEFQNDGVDAETAGGKIVPEQIGRKKTETEKSKAVYDLIYTKFEKWCEEREIKHINEKVVLDYFESKRNFKSSTLWTQYSILRNRLSLEKGVDIKTYPSLLSFLKRQSDGYHAKKSEVFTKDHIAKFLLTMDDNKFLMAKVVLIIGIAGACRKSELTYLRIDDVTDEQAYFRIKIPNTTTNVFREFVITPGDLDGLSFVDIVRKYINLRPATLKHNRFFIKYANGKCGVQPVGINTIGQLPKTIAQAIGLPNPSLYTGHCFRRSSAIRISGLMVVT